MGRMDPLKPADVIIADFPGVTGIRKAIEVGSKS